ncbi:MULTISPECIES: SHOCT domain-containing protein [unclassified Cryobacterium]|uniref:SHOCT domain-containing protein n=1 Tax=unclassified Cryobacterium TaxID=2649013 RepID=UPI002AB34511|nr:MULTISPECIES: PLDc N-terminal domain-containing protein [unclassified Cryobacterium]MDY7543436.1 PLDc N-terminal domain-containing protein [Cryobacterium sp. 5B3]MEA9999556.1 PLDc N-terminal domain-containing protein [Cryobacterium sp. RTS3]MEB0264919.1 PLDc N-terminal domain-containing protein [Cryobacterium sp. 10I5]MEB0274675.1 PLDc N-terminal domain-containing protein [Cryobacterium sp. 5B3]
MFSNFWDVVWFFFWSFAFIAYLMVLFSIVGDIFRDHKLSGGAKAVWLIFLVFVPFLTALVYLVARGPDMARRQAERVQQAQDYTDDYVRSVASSASPSGEIAKAKELLDSGSITATEFEALKAKALK